MDLTGMKVRFDSAEFERQYHYDGPLGSFCNESGTQFFLWAPTAQDVVLRLYRDGYRGGAFKTERMTSIGEGVWCWETKDNLSGTYYDYLVTVHDVARETADPYARACGINGERSMVIDLKSTDPKGWEEDKAPAHGAEAIIYEVHVKDFSWDPASGVKPEWRGKFKAFTQENTTLNDKGHYPTCLNHMKKLGVTHVQLMPVYDYGSVDERDNGESYNWGYDPANYNVPEGTYSTDPYHGEVRVRELKEAIQSLHKNGFRVIMDVVYNHTFKLDSCLWKTVPWYFYRQDEGGAASNGSGCGNELATERSMCARYIIDSVLYWAEEYHMDGFRFDLMGMLDVDLMTRIRSACDARWGKGEKLLYGEPWSGGACHPRAGTELADKGHLRVLPPEVGAFCDTTRDMVKGSVMDANGRGMINGGGLYADALACCVKGWAFPNGAFQASSPAQTISYLSCHDDWTLWDKLILTVDEKRKRFQEPIQAVLDANKMGAALYFACMGRPFLLSGEEFARTKGGLRNSYNAPAKLNKLDWNRAFRFRSLVDYYEGLIGLRKQLPALCDKSAEAANRVLKAVQVTANLAYVEIDNTGGSSRWTKLILLFNATNELQKRNNLKGSWEVLVDSTSSKRWMKPELAGEKLEIPPMSALFLGLAKE